MFGQLPFDIMFLIMLYAAGTATATIACVYLLLMGIGLLIYMVREVRRYGRWLRDNYVDLEHDLTVSQLAQAIGTNRLYLGQYFARKNTTCDGVDARIG